LSSLFDLSGHVALVTGASRGIGAAAARALASHQAAVAINYLPTRAMEAAANQVVDDVQRQGGTAVAIPADVTKAAEVDAMVARCERELGPIDVLIANAANLRRVAWEDLSEQDWDEVFAVNSTGTLLCTRAVLGSMRARNRGSIITVSSVTTELGHFASVPYIASKAGILGFTRALARIAGPDGVRVNCVMPGAIRTEQELERRTPTDEVDEALLRNQCLPRRGQAGDVAAAFVFLAAPASSFITGQVINVDGGWVHY
jgi:3-oxoacyl-[acyl-carrier protein] reductase